MSSLNEFQQRLDEFDNQTKPPTVYKKRPAPKPLQPQQQQQQSNLESKHSFGKKRQAPLPKPVPRVNTSENQTINGSKLNPVKEMELMAKNKSNEVKKCLLIYLIYCTYLSSARSQMLL